MKTENVWYFPRQVVVDGESEESHRISTHYSLMKKQTQICHSMTAISPAVKTFSLPSQLHPATFYIAFLSAKPC